jgi:hypothetical protein
VAYCFTQTITPGAGPARKPLIAAARKILGKPDGAVPGSLDVGPLRQSSLNRNSAPAASGYTFCVENLVYTIAVPLKVRSCSY